MKSISIGKLRGLQACATLRNTLAVLAMDHRGGLRRALQPSDPASVPDIEMTGLKHKLAHSLSPHASAVLLDPQYSAFQCVAAGDIPPGTGTIVALESTGYRGHSDQRKSEVLPDWSVKKAKLAGFNAIKLLVYYHPEASTSQAIESLVQKVSSECNDFDIAFFLEPLTYSTNSARGKLEGIERRTVIIDSAQRLAALGGDVLKVEFPIDISTSPDEAEWAEACAELTAACDIPWVLLSASVDFETYLRQVTVALQNGASGVAAGRAVWKEVVSLPESKQLIFLQSTAAERMARLTALCDALGTPWTHYFTMPQLNSTSFADYRKSTID